MVDPFIMRIYFAHVFGSISVAEFTAGGRVFLIHVVLSGAWGREQVLNGE